MLDHPTIRVSGAIILNTVSKMPFNAFYYAVGTVVEIALLKSCMVNKDSCRILSSSNTSEDRQIRKEIRAVLPELFGGVFTVPRLFRPLFDVKFQVLLSFLCLPQHPCSVIANFCSPALDTSRFGRLEHG